MIQIPFSRDNFADEAKSRMSGINTTLEFDNIESGLLKAAHLVADTIGEHTYSKIVQVGARKSRGWVHENHAGITG